MAEEDIDALAAAAHGFVGADLAAICDEAAMAALRRVIATRQHASSSAQPSASKQLSPVTRGSTQVTQASPQVSQASPQVVEQVSAVQQQAGRLHANESSQSPAEALNVCTVQQQATVQPRQAVHQQHPAPRPAGQHASFSSDQDNQSVVCTQQAAHSQSRSEGQVRVCANAEDSSGGQQQLHPGGVTSEAESQASSAVAAGSELQITLADFRVAETRVRPSAMREVALEVCCCFTATAVFTLVCLTSPSIAAAAAAAAAAVMIPVTHSTTNSKNASQMQHHAPMKRCCMGDTYLSRSCLSHAMTTTVTVATLRQTQSLAACLAGLLRLSY